MKVYEEGHTTTVKLFYN